MESSTRIWSLLESSWNRLANAIDRICQIYLKNVDPKHAVATYVVFNLLIAVLAGYLTKSWPDFFSVSGYSVTTTGFLVAIIELYRTRTVTAQIRLAIAEEAARQKSLHYRHCLERAKAMLLDSKTHVASKNWMLAITRLEDLNTYISHLKSISPSAVDAWTQYMRAVNVWRAQFTLARNKSYQYNVDDWEKTMTDILVSLDEELKVFQPGGGFENDPQ